MEAKLEDEKDEKSQMSQGDSGRRVILEPPPSSHARSRAWVFTVNNYNQSHIDSIVSLVSPVSTKWIYGFEVGESGTPHIQGFMRFKNQKRFSALKRALPTAHWEKAKGSDDDNYRYCSKEGNFKTNITPKLTREEIADMVRRKYYTDVQWRDWQREVLDIIGGEPCERTIYWIFEPTGNVGKSFLATYLALDAGAIICSGKSQDIFNQVNASIDGGIIPKVVVCDVPRTSLDYLSYLAIECLKNGCLYSGKYEGGKCVFPKPHVICFANERPKFEKLSRDRWYIAEIKGEEMFKLVL